MKNDRTELGAIQAATLDDYLSRWHARNAGLPLNGVDRMDAPAFREAQTYRGWEEADDIHDEEWLKFVMSTLDFLVSGDRNAQGGMDEPYKSAIYALARNCYAGSSVWFSPRLPRDSMARLEIVAEARKILMRKLNAAGVPI